MNRIEENPKFLAQLKRHEGFRNTVYRCPAGHLTIGYGHNLDVRPVKGIGKRSVISTEEGERILREDVKLFAAQLDEHMSWWRDRPEPRQAVLLNMAFNMGVKTLLSFKNTIAYIWMGQYDLAATHMTASKWAGQVGERAVELARQMKTGEWQGN